MVRRLHYAWMILFLISCSMADTKKEKIPVTATSQDAAVPDFKTLDTALSFSGLWVNEEYVKKLKKTGSPRASQDINESCITIPERTLQATNMVSGFHEGGADWVVVKKGVKYEIYNKDLTAPTRSIEILSPDKIKVGDQYFSKLKHPDHKRVDLNILEELLFSGHYQLQDGKAVEFKLDGGVSGLDSFSYYNPIIDYADEAMNIDQIELGSTKENLQPFGFRFNSDSLIIYKLKCLEYDSANKQCGVVSFGDPMYKMLRKD